MNSDTTASIGIPAQAAGSNTQVRLTSAIAQVIILLSYQVWPFGLMMLVQEYHVNAWC